MKTVTWGWEPPQFEKLNNGLIRIFFYSKPQTVTIAKKDLENEESEETIEEITNWICNTIDIEDQRLLNLLKYNPESLECQKLLLNHKINAYDSSDHVNSFTISGISTWIDKATRVGLKLRFEAEMKMGKTETTLWQNGIQFPLPLAGEVTALDILDGIELYASACYDTTQKHLAAVSEITTVEELKNYDYTADYPEKLSF